MAAYRPAQRPPKAGRVSLKATGDGQGSNRTKPNTPLRRKRTREDSGNGAGPSFARQPLPQCKGGVSSVSSTPKRVSRDFRGPKKRSWNTVPSPPPFYVGCRSPPGTEGAAFIYPQALPLTPLPKAMRMPDNRWPPTNTVGRKNNWRFRTWPPALNLARINPFLAGWCTSTFLVVHFQALFTPFYSCTP